MAVSSMMENFGEEAGFTFKELFLYHQEPPMAAVQGVLSPGDEGGKKGYALSRPSRPGRARSTPFPPPQMRERGSMELRCLDIPVQSACQPIKESSQLAASICNTLGIHLKGSPLPRQHPLCAQPFLSTQGSS